MRAAQINDEGVVINFAEVSGFSDCFLDPMDAVKGSTWDGTKFEPPLAIAPSIDQYTKAIQELLDAKAQGHGYDNILSACTYADSTVPRFHAEGQACYAWRDAVWHAADLLLKSVENGDTQQPTIPQLLAMLPTIDWPA